MCVYDRTHTKILPGEIIIAFIALALYSYTNDNHNNDDNNLIKYGGKCIMELSGAIWSMMVCMCDHASLENTPISVKHRLTLRELAWRTIFQFKTEKLNSAAKKGTESIGIVIRWKVMNRSNEIITRCMYISWSVIQNMPAFIRSDKLWIITFAKLILNSHIMIFDLLILGWCLTRKMVMRCMPWLKTDHA